jgi:hypothetical protein
MDASKTYSDRSNARKAAKRLIAAGKAPASEFDIDAGVDERFAIVWKIAEAAKPARGKRQTEPKSERGWDTPPAAPKPPTADGQAKAKATPRAIAQAAAEQGTLPQPPDFTANTHKPYRKRLAALVALVEAGDLEGLRAVEMLPPRSSSPKALHRYRDLAIIALKAAPIEEMQK